MNTQSKSILISGCSSGIGLHVALGLKQRGYLVIASARKHDDVERLRQQGLDSVQLDLNDSASIYRAVEETLALSHGRLDALFNNGAYGQPGAVEDLRRDVLRAQFETNLFGTLELTNRIIPIMRQQGHGRIIQNSSILGLITLPYRGAYNASKFALEALTDTLRLELQGSGIEVVLIEPGPIESHFRKNAFRAYRDNIDTEHSAHREIYQRMERRLTTEESVAAFTLTPDAVLRRVIHALESPRPKLRYYVTFPTYLFATLRRILPQRMLYWLLSKISSNENS